MNLNLFKKSLLLFLSIFILSCTTDDVDPTDGSGSENWFQIPDDAFGEYMVYRGVSGVYAQSVDGVTHYFINPDEAVNVTELSLSKTSNSIQELVTAGLSTAETKITDLSGIELFTNLEHIILTSNSVTEINTSTMPNLQQLELNFNLIGNLDLTQNSALTLLRYRGSGSATDSQKLSSIDLTQNPALTHLFLPNHNLVSIDLSNNSAITEMLDLSGNPGPDGNPDTADILVPVAIYNQLAPENRLGVIPDDGNSTTTATFSASQLDLTEGNSLNLTLNLNSASNQEVTAELNFTGDAILDEDFTVESTNLVIPVGETSVSVTLSALTDDLEEGSESLIVQINNLVNASLSDDSTITITLNDAESETNNLIINEVLYDPSNNDLDGDANGDGSYSQAEDEFIEFYNNSDSPLDISGYKVFDTDGLASDTPTHIFPAETVIPANGALVLFGGGNPTGSFGGAVVLTSTTGNLSLNNEADAITIKDANNVEILTFDIDPLSNNPNESYTRSPDITGEFAQSSSVSSALFSPGTKLDGSSF